MLCYAVLYYNITAAGAVDREFFYIYIEPPRALLGPPRAPPEPPRADPDHHSLPRPPELSLDVFLIFSWMSQLKHIVLRQFLAGNLPKQLSKLGVLDERGMKKSKQHCTGVSPESLLL